jgi:hypothetical protein
MQTIKRKYITYDMPGSFFPESHTQEVKSFDIPESVPLDCFAFQFHETEFVVNGKKEYEGDTVKQNKRHFIGWLVPLAKMPKGEKYAILCGNIERNSPTKTGIKTHLGNWQQEDKGSIVHAPSDFTFTKPLIYKNIKGFATLADAMKEAA